jgi:hypothetical protein
MRAKEKNARAAWYAKLEETVTATRPDLAGRLDWSTAAVLYTQKRTIDYAAQALINNAPPAPPLCQFRSTDPRPWAAVLGGSFSPYPWTFTTRDAADLCEDCARQSSEVNDGGEYMEGPPITCDECGREILSAYGTPEEPKAQAPDLAQIAADLQAWGRATGRGTLIGLELLADATKGGKK